MAHSEQKDYVCYTKECVNDKFSVEGILAVTKQTASFPQWYDSHDQPKKKNIFMKYSDFMKINEVIDSFWCKKKVKINRNCNSVLRRPMSSVMNIILFSKSPFFFL